MKPRTWIVAPVLCAAVVASVAVAFQVRTVEAVATLDRSARTPHVRSEITITPARVDPGGLATVRVTITTDPGRPDDTLSLRLHLGSDLSVAGQPASPWDCLEPSASSDETSVICRLSPSAAPASPVQSATFRVGVGDEAEGLRGVSAEAWYGPETPDVAPWAEVRAGVAADSTMISISTAHVTRPAVGHTSRDGRTDTRGRRSVDTGMGVTSTGDRAERILRTVSITRRSRAAKQSTPSPVFCALYGAASATGGSSVAAGPVTFANMTKSSTNGGPCSSSSVINLSAATISFGTVSMMNVSGTVTPTTMTAVVTVSDAMVLTITGPFPDTGTQFTASLGIPVGDSTIVLRGSVDYGDSDSFSVVLNASAGGSGWSPVPGVTTTSANVTGTFTRSRVGSSSVDSVNVNMALAGSWTPVPGVSVGSITLAIGNASGDAVVSLSAALGGRIDVAGLTVTVDGTLDGTVDAESGVVAVSGSIDPFSVAGLATFGPVSAQFVHDPRTTGADGGRSPGTTTLAGKASFTGELAQFFSGSVNASLAVLDEGFVVEASMTSGPSRQGYAQQAPVLLWASLSNPLSTVSYAPSGSSQPAVPLGHQKGVSVAPFGVPAALGSALEDLGIGLLDRVGTGSLALGLSPQDPSITIHYDAPPGTYLFGGARSTASARFMDISVGVSAGETETFTIGGDVALTLSGDVLDLDSALEISVGPTGAQLDGFLELSDASGWSNAFGMSGVTVYDLAIQAGITDGSPSFAVEASAGFPSSLTTPLGIVAGSVITLGIDFSATNPCFVFSIAAPPSNPAANVLEFGSGALTATSASMVIAPDGCSIGTADYSGFQLEFDGAIRNVKVGFSTTFVLEPAFSLTGSGYLGTFAVDGLNFGETTVTLSISDAAFGMEITGSITAGDSLRANGQLLLESSGGFSFSGSGAVKIGGDSFDVRVMATNCADSACRTLTIPTFWATGDVVTRGFSFDASIKIDADGSFDAKLTVPERSDPFSFDEGSLKGKGTLRYSFSVEVSDTESGAVQASVSATLSSCTWTIVSCKNAKLSASADVKTGSASVTIDVDAVINAKISMTVK